MLKRIIIILALFLCGCSSIPFKHTHYLFLGETDPKVLRSDFSKKLPRNFELLNSATFNYAYFNFSALGILSADTSKKTLNISGFNHLGAMLFDIRLRSDGEVDCRYALPEFNKHKDFASFIANDIKKIYFDRVPSERAQVKRSRRRVIFKDLLNGAITEYVFSGEGRFLAEKHYYEQRKKVWSVFYYAYILKDGKIYPQGIILKHHQYRYKLIIRLKEIY